MAGLFAPAAGPVVVFGKDTDRNAEPNARRLQTLPERISVN